jgi:hypothetical protein
MNGRRDKGGRRISDTKEVTTVVKAAAILKAEACQRDLGDLSPSSESEI